MSEACAAHLRAIELSVDADYAITELLRCCDSEEQRREALSFVRGQLVRQTTFGDALLAFRAVARETLNGEELLSCLREAKDARPDLWQAWSALIRQLTDTGQWDAANDLASDAVGRFPLIVPLWVDRATVCRARSDRGGEIAALRQALAINPNWSPAARQLAALHERGGEFEQSGAILRHAVVREPLDGTNHGHLADALWKLGDKDAAVAHIQQAVRLEPEYDWAWARLREWGAAVGKPKAAEEMARELTVRRAGEARSWLVLARTLDGPDVLEERLAAAARAVELDPRLTEAHDLRAELFASAGRWDEALSACQPAAWGDAPPDELRGRAAWIEWRRGNGDTAVALMRRVVADCPNYYWAWCRLAEWHRAREQYAAYLETAQHMVGLWPNSVIALGYRADARCHTGGRLGAKADLRRAMELAPGYDFAATRLFDLCLEDGELDAAGKALEVLRKHSPGDAAHLRGVQFGVRSGESSFALQCLAQLCTGPERDQAALDQAMAALRGNPSWLPGVETLIRDTVNSGNANPFVGTVWVEMYAQAGRWKAGLKLVGDLLPRGGAGINAAVAYLHLAGSAKQWALVRKCIKRHAASLRADDRSRDAVAKALRALQDDEGTTRWWRFWRRPKPQLAA